MSVRSWISLAWLCTLAGSTSAAAGEKALPQDASTAGRMQVPAVPSDGSPYYQTLRTYSFDAGGVPDPQGWTTHDLTAQSGVFWHVDDFAGLSGYAPLQGTKSMWCGVRAGVLADPFIQNAPGYGDNWTQILRFSGINNFFSGTRTVRLTARMSYDMPDPSDKVDVEYRATPGTGPWTQLGSYTGTTPAADYAWEFTSGQSVEFRFVMTSDWGGSDESFNASVGAVVIDNIRMTDVEFSATFYAQDFESYPVGTTAGTTWLGETPPAFGNYGGLISGASVYQDGAPNTTGLWSFFIGSGVTYACGGHFSQPAVPYTQVPGSTHPGDYLNNEVRSPLIDFTVDQNSQPSDPNMGSLAIEFDAYSDLDFATNGVAYGFRRRFMVNGVLQSWSPVLAFAGAVPPWTRVSSFRTGAIPIPAGATQVQFSLLTTDLGYTGQTTGTCHSQSPLFDNVSILRMYTPLYVRTPNDSGTASLRQVITSANANPNFNVVFFQFPTSGPYTINLSSPLPAITQPLWFDGFTQAGSIANTQQFAVTNAQLMVALNGSAAGPSANGLWYTPGGYGVVRGLAIGGFSGAGIRYESTSLYVTGCYIGLDGTGTLPVPNGVGILDLTQGMDIGGPYNEERVLISNSSSDGIRVLEGSTHILNCHIGYDAIGFEMANGDGIHVVGGTTCQIGPPATNPCEGESTDRVWILAGNIVVDPPASGVMISQVRFDGGYIDLGGDGTTPNDAGDADSGANDLLNFPVLTSVGATTIVGDMDGLPNTTHRIEFFSGDGFQNETTYLGYQNVTTNGSGHASISFSCGAIPPASNIIATATVGINTSEYSPWITYNNTPPGSSLPPIPLYDSSSVLRASVQFTNVQAPGNTFLNPTTPSTPNPLTWNVGTTPLYWDISTTAPYSGPIHIVLYYDPTNIPGPENTLRLLHFQNSQWVDVTDSFDFTANWIGGTVTSLSPFVLAMHTGATGVGDTPAPDAFALRANVPNPFNPATTIDYDVRRGGADVTIAIFDVSGRLIRTLVDEHRDGGRYRAQWNGLDQAGRTVASGVYFYRMRAGSFSETRKMVLLK